MSSSKKSDSGAKDQLYNEFEAWIKRIAVTAYGEASHKDYVYVLNPFTLSWNDNDVSRLRRLITDVIPKISSQSIDRELENTVKNLFSQVQLNSDIQNNEWSLLPQKVLDTGDTSKELQGLLTYLKSSVGKDTFSIPIQGIKFSPELQSLTINNSVLFPISEETFSKENFRDKNIEEIRKIFEAAGCFLKIFDVEGDPEFRAQQAMIKANEIVDILNFLFASCKQRIQRGYHKINIVGQPSSNLPQVYISPKSYAWKRLATQFHEINEEVIQQLKEFGAYQVENIFHKAQDKNSPILNRIKSAVTWYSSAVNADIPEIQFVSLMTALEILLVGEISKDPNQNSGSISQRLSERVAFLLGNNYQKRLELEKKAKQLYGLRSDIVHGGKKLNDIESLFELESIVRTIVVVLLKHDFQTWETFIDWEKRQKYTSLMD